MNARSLVFLLLASAIARGESFLEISVHKIPREATALVFVVDTTMPAEAPNYDDAPPPPPPAATPADPAATPAAGQPQRRRRSFTAATKPPPAVRTELTLANHAESVKWRTTAPTGDNIRVRVAAITGDAPFPLVVAGGKVAGVKTTADAATAVTLALAAPSLKLAADAPPAVAPGAKFVLAGVLTDPGSFLGTKNRMRVWLSANTAPTSDRSGTQVSTIDVATKGDDVAFTFELTAPPEPGVLYFQFGEVSSEFARVDGTQAPFLVLPSVARGAALQMKVQRPAATALISEK